MCLAIPGRILSIEDNGDPVTGVTALVDFQGSRVEASLAMTPEAVKGDWVLVHAGFAMTILNEAEARENWESLKLALGEDIELPGKAPGDQS
jgi:hydrogenase expression/formation protein HypC